MSTQELSLFDLGVEDTAKEEKKKQKVNVAPVIVGEKKEETFLVNADWTIHLATETFLVSDFVANIPAEGVLLDEVREGMERVFMQYTKARTKWDIDEENKRLFPDAFAGSKGLGNYRLAPVLFTNIEAARNSNALSKYIIDERGICYRYEKTVMGELIVKTTLPPLRAIQEEFHWKLPRIPKYMLDEIQGLFQYYGELDSPLEVAVRVYWDIQTETFVLEVPKQTVSPVRVEMVYSNQFTGRNSLRYIPVLELHSHNIMRAFFSEVDDADEVAYRVYGVIGRLNRQSVEMKFRVKVCGDTIPISVSDIFEVSGIEKKGDVEIMLNEPKEFPKEWLQNVTITKGWYA